LFGALRSLVTAKNETTKMADIEIHSEEDFEADEEGDSEFVDYTCCILFIIFSLSLCAHSYLVVRSSACKVGPKMNRRSFLPVT